MDQLLAKRRFFDTTGAFLDSNVMLKSPDRVNRFPGRAA
jgi:hypothetical protein